MKFLLEQTWREIQDQLRGPLVPIVFLGVAAFQIIMLTSAEYTQELTVLGVPVNSPYWVYRWSAGQAIWMYFVWAWIFSRPVLRDREAVLQEIVLSAPIPLNMLVLARYLGALVVGAFVGAAPSLGFLLLPVISAFGGLSSDLIGPTPFMHLVWSAIFLTTPAAIGVGALCLAATIRMRSVSGAFAVSALAALLWVFGVSILNEGNISPIAASLIDASSYPHVARVTDGWTIQQKASAILPLDGLLLANRLLWVLAPLAALSFVLVRMKREDLLSDRATTSEATPRNRTNLPVFQPAAKSATSWLAATLQETCWHAAVSLRGWGFWLSYAFIVIVGCASVYMRLQVAPDGPFYTYAHLTEIVIIGAVLLFVLIFIASFTGMIARRDERMGFKEIVDATPAPLGVHVVGKAFAAMILTVLVALAPMVSVVLLSLAAPAGLAVLDPFIFGGLLLAPAMLQVCILTFFLHCFIKSPGTAYSLSIIFVFFAAINHEQELLGHPLAQFSIPVHAAQSELTGWTPWLEHAYVGGLYRLAIVGVILAFAWLFWRRGVAMAMKERLTVALGRVPGMGGAIGAASLLTMVATGVIIHTHTVELGDYTSMRQDNDKAARLEKKIDATRGAFTVAGGKAFVFVDVAEATARSVMELDMLEAPDGILHGDLPRQGRILGVKIDDSDAEVDVIEDHFTIDMARCADKRCSLTINLEIDASGWSFEERPMWLNKTSAWMRASDVLPKLGLNPTQYLRVPAVRRQYGLAETPPNAPTAALAPLSALAPGENWTWSVEFSEPGETTPLSGTIDGPLDFAVGWSKKAVFARTEGDGVIVVHGKRRSMAAETILIDVSDMRNCVADILGAAPDISTIAQAPRFLGDLSLHGNLLWAPEEQGWDVGFEGAGRLLRRVEIARVIAARHLETSAALRDEEGARWLTSGAAGWIALECLRSIDGSEAWRTVLDLKGVDITAELGASRVPVTRFSQAFDADWAKPYAAYSTLVWAEGAGRNGAADVIRQITTLVRSGRPTPAAMRDTMEVEIAETLLGPPSASSIAIAAVKPDGSVTLTAQRWVWRNGDWVEAEASGDVLQSFDDKNRSPLIVNADAVSVVAGNGGTFTLLPSTPAFERTLTDNI
ncbi:MAG: hypothetical protein AAGC95_14710 [Pseudomonadota bacterium]